MSIAYQDKTCYRHWASLTRNPFISEEERNRHSLCYGFKNGLSSLDHCLDFVSVADIQRGICAYEHRAENGFGESPVKSIPESCLGCNSNHHSGENPSDTDPKKIGCTSYTPMLYIIQGICAWHVRSERLLDLHEGNVSQLKPEEYHCLRECTAKKDVSCSGYIDVKDVVMQTCAHKVYLNKKLSSGSRAEGLEEICNRCKGQCDDKKCNGSYISITEKHHFEAINDLHPLIKRESLQTTA